MQSLQKGCRLSKQILEGSNGRESSHQEIRILNTAMQGVRERLRVLWAERDGNDCSKNGSGLEDEHAIDYEKQTGNSAK